MPPIASMLAPDAFTKMTSRPGAIASFRTPSSVTVSDSGVVPLSTVQPVAACPSATLSMGNTGGGVVHGVVAATAAGAAGTRDIAASNAIDSTVARRLDTDRYRSIVWLLPRSSWGAGLRREHYSLM